MRKMTILFLLAFQLGVAQESEVKRTIESFFTAFHAKDTVKLKSLFIKEAVMHSVSEKNPARFSVENIQDFFKSIASIPEDVKFEERLLAYKIQIDGSMAQVWAPYEFYINGKLGHTGVNSFHLFKDKTDWKITYCIDTRKRP